MERILAGSKKYEFRKRLANRTVDKILMYSTAPIMKVVGEVEVVKTISSSPSALWEYTKKFAGISRDKYRKYFKGCKAIIYFSAIHQQIHQPSGKHTGYPAFYPHLPWGAAD